MRKESIQEIAEAKSGLHMETDLAQIEDFRAQLHQLVDSSMDTLISRLHLADAGDKELRHLPLTANSAFFKGQKAVSVVLPDGREVLTSTWKKVAEAIMQDCNADEERHQKLMFLRSRVNGNFRAILSSGPERLDVPLKIDEDLYLESKFDTGALLHVLKEKILKVVDYDCQGVTIKYRPRQQRLTSTDTPVGAGKEPAAGMELRM